ncbi:MAG: hypothetical protein KAJ31_02145 [Deltaproteobacteria bacterium]|nr:hypothetical protein [Deltaproteobacteria bacterium]MCK5710873.1 hypothetical protein [Deltaproteobacteria bacterium]
MHTMCAVRNDGDIFVMSAAGATGPSFRAVSEKSKFYKGKRNERFFGRFTPSE